METGPKCQPRHGRMDRTGHCPAAILADGNLQSSADPRPGEPLDLITSYQKLGMVGVVAGPVCEQ